MIKRLFTLCLAICLTAGLAAAGDCLTGSCANGCPIAKSASARTATGGEAVAVSATMKRELAETVFANLEAI